MLITSIVLILFSVGLLLSTFGSAFGSLTTGGKITYDENVFQDYANEQYMAEFGSASDSEDSLMLIFLVEDEAYYEYAYIAWCGDHINSRIHSMFGAEGTKFGNAIANSAINSGSYKYSLDSGIAQVVNSMRWHIEALGLEDSLTCGNEQTAYESHLINRSEINMTDSTVNTALEEFTAATGLAISVVVEDADEVLPRNFDYLSVFIALIFIGVAIYIIVKAVNSKNRKKKPEEDENYNRYADK